MMMASPSTKPAVKVVLSRITLMVDALNDRRSMGPGLEATVSITEAVPSASDKDTWVEVWTIPWSQAMKFIATTRVMCATDVWSVGIEHIARASLLYILPPHTGRWCHDRSHAHTLGSCWSKSHTHTRRSDTSLLFKL